MDADDEIKIQRSTLARLITAHTTLLDAKTTGDREAVSLRASLSECGKETEAVRSTGQATIRLWKGRFWISVGIAATITALAITSSTLHR